MSATRLTSITQSRRFKIGVALCAATTLVTGAVSFAAVDAANRQSAAASEPTSSGGPATARRLDESQYKHTIAQIFGADIKVPGRFEPPVRESGLLAIGNSKVIVTPAGFEQYALRAREISAQVLDDAHRKTFLTCEPQAAASFDEACARQFFETYGRLLFRRPLSDQEMATVVKLARDTTTKSGSFDTGIQAGLTSLLVSPSFIFRVERTEADPGHPGLRRLDVYSLATRISFLLWDAPPDEELLNAAGSGALSTKAGLGQQVDRMMASPKFEQGVRAFFSDMLGYDQFDGLSKDSALFPIFSPKLRDDAEEQSLRTIVDLLITQNGDYRDLFTTKKTFLSRSLGALYGVKVDYQAFSGWMPYTFPDGDPHGGLLTLPGFLMLDASHEGRSSPTIRGKTVREHFLCQKVPNPPANVNFSIVQNVNDPVHKTARERLMAHQDNPSCAGCHRITDPIGLSLENYTPVGSYRTTENGVPIDVSGSFEGKNYQNAIEFTKLLRESPSTQSCIVQRAFEYGTGRDIATGEQTWLEYLNSNFAAAGYRFPALIRRIATSDAFQAVSSDAQVASIAK